MKKLILSIAICVATVAAYGQSGKKNSSKENSTTRVRSAETGRYVNKEEAKKNPKTTVTETSKPRNNGGGRKK